MSVLKIFKKSFSSVFSVNSNSVTYNSLAKRLKNENPKSFLHFQRCINIRHYATYDADGKTYGVVINKKNQGVLSLAKVVSYGFIISDGTELAGSTILFPNAVLSWHVQSVKEVNEESLTLFKILDPQPDILILGYGNPQDYTPEIRKNLHQLFKKLGLKYEALPTEQAAGLFNFLSEDLRYVAAALITVPFTKLYPLEKVKGPTIQEIQEEIQEEEKQKYSLPISDKEDFKKLT